MQAYTGFAYVYDEYMDNIPYEEWCEYLVERLKEQGVTPDMEIADLGCGTGTVTQLLDKAGYSCVGIDNAPDMLTIAAEKLYESGQEIVYSLQDMRDFELPYEVDAMVSIADSMNYITSKEDITSVFECVKKGLKPGGLFWSHQQQPADFLSRYLSIPFSACQPINIFSRAATGVLHITSSFFSSYFSLPFPFLSQQPP